VSLSCSDGPSAPAEPLSETFVSAHFTYHRAAGDAIDTTWQEAYYAWVVPALGVQPTARLDYSKYRDRAHLEAVTGKVTNGFAEPGTMRFHTIWPIDNHEGVHALVTAYIGHPPALFNEGVAVAHQTDPLRGQLDPRWNGTDIDVLARQYLLAGKVPALSRLLESTDFFDFDTNVTYPVAGSLVRYLLSRFGIARFKGFIAKVEFSDRASRLVSIFGQEYGVALDAVWSDFQAWLRSSPATG
jgi:hypothetical protein